jgi:hypothetical protein
VASIPSRSQVQRKEGTQMKIDPHVYTKTCSDGNLSIEEMFEEAKNRGFDLI